MDLTKFWVIVVFIVCYEESSIANNVNVLNTNHPGRSRPKKSINTEIYLALPPDSVKVGKQDSTPTLLRLDPNAPNKFKGKFPTPIERFIQRIQNYFSVYNPPEYLNDLQRPGINNPESDGDQIDQSDNTQVTLPCNGTSTIVIIPVPLENENVPTDHNSYPDKLEVYNVPTTAKPTPCAEETTTSSKPKCPEVTTPIPKCPEMTTPRPKCPGVNTPRPNCPEVTTPRPKCPEVTTPRPNCPEVTTPKPKCPEVTTPKPSCPEVTTPKPNCPEVTTQKPKCPEVTTPKTECPEVTTPNPECLEETTQKPPYSIRQNTTSSDPKPISGYGPTEVPPINLVAQPVIGPTLVYFYKNPSTYFPNPPSYYIPSTPTPYEEHTRKPKPPILRLKQLLFPRLYAAFHPDD